MSFDIDQKALDDLVAFARIEVESRDVEPWAMLMRDMYQHQELDREQAIWLLTLYNTYDSLESAWSVFRRWQTPLAWAVAKDGLDAASYPIMQERRNLFGGRVLRRMADYNAHLTEGLQHPWLSSCLMKDDVELDFRRLMTHVRQVWGVGRQAAFEWAEFLGKVVDYPVHAPDAELWESSGPRRSLQRIYGNPNPDHLWLDTAAHHARSYLADKGIDLAWEDFETIICDFNVMRDGRYYPGRHLAALRGEIDALPVMDQAMLNRSWDRIIPTQWADIAPGINKDYMSVYRDSGLIRDSA